MTSYCWQAARAVRQAGALPPPRTHVHAQTCMRTGGAGIAAQRAQRTSWQSTKLRQKAATAGESRVAMTFSSATLQVYRRQSVCAAARNVLCSLFSVSRA